MAGIPLTQEQKTRLAMMRGTMSPVDSRMNPEWMQTTDGRFAEQMANHGERGSRMSPNAGMTSAYVDQSAPAEAAKAASAQSFTGREGKIKSQRSYADSLRGRAAPQGMTAGPLGVYYGPNIGQSLEYAASQLAGGYMDRKANEADIELDIERGLENARLEKQGRDDWLQEREWKVEDQESLAKAKLAAAGVDINSGIRKGENDLRKDFSSLTHIKDFKTQDSAYLRVVDSAQDSSAAGDLALIFNYMKILDPLSVVRESEFKTAEQASRWMQALEDKDYEVPRPIAKMVRMMATGERMSDEQRVDFVDRASRLYEGASQGYQQTADRYRKLAEGYGYNPENVILTRPTNLGEEEQAWLNAFLKPKASIEVDQDVLIDVPIDVPDGVDPKLWESMSPEQHKEFIEAGD